MFILIDVSYCNKNIYLHFLSKCTLLHYIIELSFSFDVLVLRLLYSILISFNKVEIFVPSLAEIGIIGKFIYFLSNCKLI